MRDKKCEVIRRELEELSLNQQFSGAAAEHMRGCADCREFQRQQTKLRQIVGSLGTVDAPADFDFRLRARLAADSESSGIRYWSFAVRGLATVAVLVVFGVGAVIVWQSTRPATTVAHDQPQGQSQHGPSQQAQVEQGHSAPPQDEPAQNVDQVKFGLHKESLVVDSIPRRNSGRPNVNRPGQRITSVDRASLRANVYPVAQPTLDTATVFPIDTSLQSVKVSLDDGRGNARTISFPTVTFGSQRVQGTGNQIAPKEVVW
jgi:hypothetical protein